MGYLFENLKGIDIGKMQEESRKLKENIENMKEELTDAQSQLTDAKSQLTDTQSQLTDAKSQLTDTRSELELTRKKLLHLVDRHAERMYGRQVSEREALEQLMELFDLSKNEALEIIHRYWK